MEWHDIREPNDPELDRLAAKYNIHPLHVEDCRHRNQSAKVEENPGYLFVVLKPVEVLADGSIDASDLDLLLGPDFLITVQEGGDAKVRAMLEQIRASYGTLRADQLLYRIADSVVDSYLPTIDHFNEVLDELEDEVLEKPTPQALARIFAAKRALIELRRVLANTRDVANHLLRIENTFIRRDIWPFFRDVYDHTARSLDMVEMQRDLLTGTLDIYLSSVANRTNNVMKALTMLGTITLPVLLVSSFYGMNLDNLPWAQTSHGIIFVAAVMAALTVALALVLRLFRWL
ncbi:MAG: magnesium transporter CorA family protein [Bryobacteraceae bacterium]|nr:magnesium transporter CorA family protein [Bryobacteraceae bacterium]